MQNIPESVCLFHNRSATYSNKQNSATLFKVIHIKDIPWSDTHSKLTNIEARGSTLPNFALLAQLPYTVSYPPDQARRKRHIQASQASYFTLALFQSRKAKHKRLEPFLPSLPNFSILPRLPSLMGKILLPLLNQLGHTICGIYRQARQVKLPDLGFLVVTQKVILEL